jgi:hypothetical protein
MLPKDPSKHEEYKRQISERLKNKPKSELHRLHMSEAKSNPSEETRQRMRDSHKGYHHSKESNQKRKLTLTGKSKTPAHREHIRLSKLGIPRPEKMCKKLSDDRKGWIGDKNPFFGKQHSELSLMRMVETRIGGFWYGNVRYNYHPQYCELWTEKLRERVRAYRGYVCFECGKLQSENIDRWGKIKNLAVHHVHYNKKTCCDGSPYDLVPLCLACHAKTNKNKLFWEQRLTEKIYSLDQTGKCFFTKEEMESVGAL